jgi:hypothetical protein
LLFGLGQGDGHDSEKVRKDLKNAAEIVLSAARPILQVTFDHFLSLIIILGHYLSLLSNFGSLSNNLLSLVINVLSLCTLYHFRPLSVTFAHFAHF